MSRWLVRHGYGTAERPVAVIASGERWPDGSLRPAMEDLLGAGAIISGRGGSADDVAVSTEVDVCTAVPVLVDRAFTLAGWLWLWLAREEGRRAAGLRLAMPRCSPASTGAYETSVRLGLP
ncbi:hypothetical protein ACH4D5_36165 [Streptomyces sp. NPDC018029]|uniref:hypothetical protein n=1 Tax=Streptomyces sp. NPDC018029 TaxID=3365032 RepID=UPI0037A972E9